MIITSAKQFLEFIQVNASFMYAGTLYYSFFSDCYIQNSITESKIHYYFDDNNKLCFYRYSGSYLYKINLRFEYITQVVTQST